MIQVQKGWREREKAGNARSTRRLVSPEIREIRAAHLAAAEAAARGAAIDAEVEAKLKAAQAQVEPKVEMEDVSETASETPEAVEADAAPEAEKPAKTRKGK